jgi:hypothetical protein
VRLAALVLEAASPVTLAGFWAHALGGWRPNPVGEGAGRSVALVPTDATSFGLLVRPGAGAKEARNRTHLDLTSASPEDQREVVDGLLARGAVRVDVGQGPDAEHVVLADPEGNELCVIEPGNRFLAGCPRLGAVNLDGTRALGHFWSQALAWPLVWDQDEETAIQSPDGTGPKLTWSGPPLLPKPAQDRFHLHVAPVGDDAVERLLDLGASPLDGAGGHGCPGTTPLAGVDANAFCLDGP